MRRQGEKPPEGLPEQLALHGSQSARLWQASWQRRLHVQAAPLELQLPPCWVAFPMPCHGPVLKPHLSMLLLSGWRLCSRYARDCKGVFGIDVGACVGQVLRFKPLDATCSMQQGVTSPKPVITTLRTCSGGGIPNASSMRVTLERY
jgi:hypothetical protein